MARKGWTSLSVNYRNRLLRGGITEEVYNSGADLREARGHKSAVKEEVKEVSFSDVLRYLKKENLAFGKMTDAKWKAGIKKHGKDKAARIAARRLQSYNAGTNMLIGYAQEKDEWPDAWFYYHSN